MKPQIVYPRNLMMRDQFTFEEQIIEFVTGACLVVFGFKAGNIRFVEWPIYLQNTLLLPTGLPFKLL